MEIKYQNTILPPTHYHRMLFRVTTKTFLIAAILQHVWNMCKHNMCKFKMSSKSHIFFYLFQNILLNWTKKSVKYNKISIQKHTRLNDILTSWGHLHQWNSNS